MDVEAVAAVSIYLERLRDLRMAEDEFVQHAARYSEAMTLSRAAWLAAGVDEAVLDAAGIDDELPSHRQGARALELVPDYDDDHDEVDMRDLGVR